MLLTVCLEWVMKVDLCCLFIVYSWIAHQLDIGRTSAFLLLMSDFKSETSFGFLIENYTGHVV